MFFSDDAEKWRWQYPEGDLKEQGLPSGDVHDTGVNEAALWEALILHVHHCVRPLEPT